jgi:cytochrome c peroxidase
MTFLRCFLLPAAVLTALPAAATGAEDKPGRTLGLEFLLQSGGKPLALHQPGALRDAGQRPLALTRLDFLLSGLALQRADGSWMESADWYALVSAGMGLTRTQATGVPAEKYSALRFYIGPDMTANAGDPHRWEPGHALHPQTAGLHWGWQGGYIFMAAEGTWMEKKTTPGGWSWHIATDALRMKVELPADLDMRTAGSVLIAFDTQKLAAAADLVKDGTSTHSREGDTLAPRLKSAVEQAFRVERVSTDRFQETAAATAAVKPRGTPLPLRISSRLPRVKLPEDNPLTLEGVELGRRLFHETALSVNRTISCASCHQPEAAFADTGKVLSTGVGGKTGTRNSMPLFNLAWQQDFFWDGRVNGLRHQVLHPIADPVEMAHTPEAAAAALAKAKDYPPRFAEVFGDAKITPERIGLAVEQFLLTLVSQESKFDRAARGETALTPEEQRGLELFVTEHDPARGLRGADCFHCHGGNLFTTGQFANNGLDAVFQDKGRSTVTGSAGDDGKFRIPSLRNIALTAPYMHDGRFATLEEVIAHYDHGIQRSTTLDPNIAKHPEAGLGLSAEDQRALIAFLKTLTDEHFAAQAKR